LLLLLILSCANAHVRLLKQLMLFALCYLCSLLF